MPKVSQVISAVTKTTLRAQVLDKLHVAITSGELPGGYHLSEVALAEQLNVSRGTLRESMRRLEQEGLLVSDGRGRMQVRRVTAREVRELYQVRSAVESLAARLVASLPDRTTVLSELSESLHTLADAQGHLGLLAEADLAFHRRICELSGNETLVRTWDSLEGAIRLSMTRGGLERALSNMALDRHRPIVDAIATGDTATIQTAVETHMSQASDRLVAAIDSQEFPLDQAATVTMRQGVAPTDR